MDSTSNRYDLVIIGAGPTGLEAALQAADLGMNYLLLEKKYVGALIKDTMAEKKFYHVYGRNTASLKGNLAFPDRIVGSELVALWQEQAKNLHVTIDTIERIEKMADDFHIIRPGQSPAAQDCPVHRTAFCGYRAKKVLLTSGTFENPRKLHVLGEADHPNIFYTLDYYNNYADKQIIVVGGGNSALETALYHGERNKILLLVRKDHFADSVTSKNKGDVEAMVNEGKIEIWWQSKIISLSGQTTKIDRNGEEQERLFDYMFIHAGYEKPLEFLESCGIKIIESPSGSKPKYNEQFETNVPGLFIAGALTGADSVIECANQAYDIVRYLHTAKL